MFFRNAIHALSRLEGKHDVDHFNGLLHSSRIVLADIFQDDQVEVATNYPPSFSRLCELIGQ
jgi:hypothetical protein